jgi:3' exoribonuclease, RNase T-like
MKFFLDTEFYENGPHQPIRLISIGIVCQDGRELYLENAGIDLELLSPWLKLNVVPHLKQTPDVQRTLGAMAEEIRKFIPPLKDDATKEEKLLYESDPPEFWGYFADYDWVVFCQLFGAMIDLPKGYPMFCYDLKQMANWLSVPRQAYPKQEGQEHNALEDARWNKKLYDFLCDVIAKERFGR